MEGVIASGEYTERGDSVIEEVAFECKRWIAVHFEDQVNGWRAEEKGSSQGQRDVLKFRLMPSGLAWSIRADNGGQIPDGTLSCVLGSSDSS